MSQGYERGAQANCEKAPWNHKQKVGCFVRTLWKALVVTESMLHTNMQNIHSVKHLVTHRDQPAEHPADRSAGSVQILALPERCESYLRQVFEVYTHKQ